MVPDAQAGVERVERSPSELLALRADDGAFLAARFYRAAEPVSGAVLIAPAMAVPQKAYGALASFLAGEGFHTLTLDYRGTGESKRESLRKLDADLLTWAELDLPAALEALAQRAGPLPITWVGHSLGGQVVPLVPNHARIARMITIASGNGYWKFNSPRTRRVAPILWFGAVPILTPIFGYFPGDTFKMVGDLPAGVIRQWRRWCLDPRYCVGAEAQSVAEKFASFSLPVVSLSFTDDEMMSAKSISTLHQLFGSREKTFLRLSPDQLNLSRIGHFGVLKRTMEGPLWREYILPNLVRISG